MRPRVSNSKRHDVVTRWLLVLLLFRAYVPLGFMPAAGTPFLLELCPAAASVPMSLPMPEHHHHGASHGHFEQCPFGSASNSGPVSQSILCVPPAPISSFLQLSFLPLRMAVRAARAHPPRGPPSLV